MRVPLSTSTLLEDRRNNYPRPGKQATAPDTNQGTNSVFEHAMRFSTRRASQLLVLLVIAYSLRRLATKPRGRRWAFPGRAPREGPPLPDGAWRADDAWDARMQRRLAGCAGGGVPAAACALFLRFDALVEMGRASNGTVNVAWATPANSKWPENAACEDTEAGPALPLSMPAEFLRAPPPTPPAFDPGPWHRCPVRCCQHPPPSRGGPPWEAADAIRFDWSAVGLDPGKLEGALGEGDELWDLPLNIPWILYADSEAVGPLAYGGFLKGFEVRGLRTPRSQFPLIGFSPYQHSELLARSFGSLQKLLTEFKSREPRILVLGNCTSATPAVDPIFACHPTSADPESLRRKYRYELSTDGGWTALASGMIPILLGPNVHADLYPPNSVLWTSSLAPSALSTLIRKHSSDFAIRKLLTWRADKDLGGAWVLWEVNKYSPQCRSCLAVLGWRVGQNGTLADDGG